MDNSFTADQQYWIHLVRQAELLDAILHKEMYRRDAEWDRIYRVRTHNQQRYARRAEMMCLAFGIVDGREVTA